MIQNRVNGILMGLFMAVVIHQLEIDIMHYFLILLDAGNTELIEGSIIIRSYFNSSSCADDDISTI